MFSDPLVVPFETSDPTNDAKTREFVLVSLGNGSSERRYIEGGAPGMPNRMRISHQVTGKGSTARQRHLVRFDTCEIVSAQPIPGVETAPVREGNPIASIYCVLDLPLGWEYSQQCKSLIQQMLGCLRGSSGLPIDWDVLGEEPKLDFVRGWINGQV